MSSLLWLWLSCTNVLLDADEDGITEDLDCDDADPDIGLPLTWYVDADGDGWGGETTTESCAEPSDFVAVSGDCDDTAPTVFPEAPELCEDGLDNDCSGGDETCHRLTGNLSVAGAWLEIQGEVTGESCGRAVATGADGAWLSCTRGADNAGRVAWIPLDTPPGVRTVSQGVVLAGEGDDGQAGRDLAVGDANGDGVEDVLVGAYGIATAALHLGPHVTSGLLAAGHALVVGADGDETGRGVLLLDLDLDGVDEVVVGQPAGAGEIGVYWGPVNGELEFQEADAWIVGEAEDAAAGTALASAGDADGDGLADLLIGASRDSTAHTHGGSVSLVLGPPSDGSLSDAHARWNGTDAYHNVGSAIASGDLDGDGNSDAVLGAHGDGLIGYYGGAVYVDLGPTTGIQDITESDWSLLPSDGAWFLGISVHTADLDGNGDLDLVVGGHGHRDYAGATWVIYGPITGGVAVLNADAQLQGLDAEDGAGFAAEAYGDGVFLGAYQADGAAPESGAVYWMRPE